MVFFFLTSRAGCGLQAKGCARLISYILIQGIALYFVLLPCWQNCVTPQCSQHRWIFYV